MEDRSVHKGHTSLLAYFGRLTIAGLSLLVGLALLSGFPILPNQPNSTQALGAALLVLSTLVIGWTWIACRYRARWTLYPTRLVQQEGLLARNTSEVDLEDIRNIQVDQSLLHRLLGIGDMLVSTAARYEDEIVACGIRDPHGFADLLRRQKDKLKNLPLA
jgi:uncharacterized membrane protein YdbT with pleckstrin-like domain